MIANEPRCRYRANPLGEVICQLRFPEILSIETTLPAQFQDAIREIFPVYTLHKESAPPKITGVPGALRVENPPTTNNYQFSSQDNVWRVNLTSRFLSLACSKYTSWEDFAAMLDKPLAAFIQIYKPAYYERVGLRYLNFISRKALGLEGTPFSALISPCYLGILAEDDVTEVHCSRSGVDAEMKLRGGCSLKLHAGPGMVRRGNNADQEVKFIFDQDLYMPGNVPINLSAPCLQTLHSQAWEIFRGAITATLHNAMEPEDI